MVTIDKQKLTVLYCIGITFLIVAGLWISPLLLLAVFLHAIAVFKLPTTNSLQILFFLLPFGLIYKYPGATTSFFTIIQLFVIGKHYIFNKKNLNTRIFFIIMLVMIYFLLRMNSYYMAIPKLLCAFLLVIVFIDNYNKDDVKDYTNFLMFGIFLSSFLGLFKETIPQLLSYYSDLNYGYINGVKTLRFSGLFDDPNYFSMALICCLVLLIVLYHSKKYKTPFFLITFAMLSVLGLFTYSKSFLLIYAATIIYSILLTMKQRKIGITIFQVVLVIGALSVIFSGKIEIFNNIFSRFSDSQGLTTGRDVIWQNYWSVINESDLNKLFGLGLDAPYVLEKAAHNMYIELIYYVGYTGLVIYMLSWIVVLFSKHTSKIKLYNLFLPIVIFVMYAFLCGFLNYAFPFYIILSWIAMDFFEVKGDLYVKEY